MFTDITILVVVVFVVICGLNDLKNGVFCGTYGRTHRRTDKTSYKDAQSYLKRMEVKEVTR